MRVECTSCNRVAEGRFELADHGSALAVTCLSCGVMATEKFSSLAETTRLPVAVDELCPKCGALRQPQAVACRACGIASDRMAAYAETRDAAVPESIKDEWTAMQGPAWSDPARHDALLLLVAREGCYAWAAGRYRDASRARPGDAVAPRQLDRLRRAGEATLFATASMRPEKSKTPYTAVIAILGVLVIAIVSGVLYAAAKSKDPPPPTVAPLQVR